MGGSIKKFIDSYYSNSGLNYTNIIIFLSSNKIGEININNTGYILHIDIDIPIKFKNCNINVKSTDRVNNIIIVSVYEFITFLSCPKIIIDNIYFYIKEQSEIINSNITKLYIHNSKINVEGKIYFEDCALDFNYNNIPVLTGYFIFNNQSKDIINIPEYSNDILKILYDYKNPMTIKLMTYNNYDCISLSEYPEQINTKEITEEITEEIKNIIKDKTIEIKNLIKQLDTDKNTDWIKKNTIIYYF